MLTTLAQIARLARICAMRPGGRIGILYFAVVFGMGLAGVHITVRLIRWTADFYNALQRLDVSEAVHQIGVFFALIAISATLFLVSSYIQKVLRMRWRKTLTEAMLEAWLAGKAYWHLRERTEHGLDNPDQRIADDCRIFVYRLTSEALDVLTNVVALVTYVSILWSLSTFPLAFSLFGLDIEIPRYMVWAAPIYVALASGLTHWLGAPLVPLNYEQQKAEADFRFALARFRQSGEAVALAGGESAERAVFEQRFAEIMRNWRALIGRELILGCFTRPYMQTVLRIPLFLALPAFLAGKVTFGGLMQLGSAFQNVVTTLSWFVFSYRDLAELAATAKRLDHFLNAANGARNPPSGIAPAPAPAGSLAVPRLSLTAPDGGVILEVGGIEVAPGETVWIRGRSGLGKTTFLRALAGLWPQACGTVATPQGRLFFLPQQVYWPLGTVADALCYPSRPEGRDAAALATVLREVGLGRLADPEALFSDQALAGLSGGEKQRLALARVLIAAPDWVFLDEATSALDVEAERQLLSTLRRRLPGAALVIIAHRRPVGLGEVREIMLDPQEARQAERDRVA